MKLGVALPLLLTAFLIAPSPASAQDEKLRSQAIAILERANSVSLSPNIPNLERVDEFRAFSPNSSAREGSFSRVVVQGIGRREETTFGDYHVINIWKDNVLETTRPNTVAPAEVSIVMRITPILLVRLDQSDVVQSITERRENGMPIQCIGFVTIVGQNRQDNEVCVDAATGAIVSEKLAGSLTEYSNFFSFAGALYPANIKYSNIGGGLTLEISQTMRAPDDSTANVLAAPPDATTLKRCTTFRRAIGQSMPQPSRGNGSHDYDVVVRGLIGSDGKVYYALVQSSQWQDLNAEALSVIAQWSFLPSMCDGHPNTVEASFLLTFRGR
jgi:hypothetical protein